MHTFGDRAIKNSVLSNFFKGKAIIIIGPRQVGKTTFANTIIRTYEDNGVKVLRINCDNPTDREVLTDKDLSFLEKLVGDARVIFIDEGQKVSTIGQTIKLLIDRFGTEKQIFVTGSSSFHLLNHTQEALTGRKYVYSLYPLAFLELYKDTPLTAQKELSTHLIYGSYPDVINQASFAEKREVITELASSKLYKDILEFQDIRNSNVLHTLLKALALQVGSEVSYTELANTVGIDKNTVERYIDLLEKSFILFRLPPYFVNKRKEIRKSKKIYFYDTGIRNSIIQNFNPLDARDDRGVLWENFLIVERMKRNEYRRLMPHSYFWRTYGQQEIDYVEEYDGVLSGYEFKFSDKKQPKPPTGWITNYKDAMYSVITPENYLDFIV